ncbi:hypothetical protein GCM10009663_51040 [Kitasatospora arboriphila]|uniref:Nucleotide pyrophosphohydrolase n=1 Tax=Kitasatospora arboriphila TaxID=258052 RepID=A0ABN1TTF3_9ACTN
MTDNDKPSGPGGSHPGRGGSGRPAPEPGPAPGEDALVRLSRRLDAFAAARSWQPYHTPKNLAAALSVEAGELLEIFQWLTPEQADAVMAEPDRAHRVRDEVADVLAYLLQFCSVVGVDPAEALAAKIERNEERFPVPGRSPAAGEGVASRPPSAGGKPLSAGAGSPSGASESLPAGGESPSGASESPSAGAGSSGDSSDDRTG